MCILEFYYPPPPLLRSATVLLCPGGVLKAVYRVSLSVHAEINEHQVSFPAFKDVQPTCFLDCGPTHPTLHQPVEHLPVQTVSLGAKESCEIGLPFSAAPAFVLQVLSEFLRLDCPFIPEDAHSEASCRFPSLGSDYLSKSFVNSKTSSLQDIISRFTV